MKFRKDNSKYGIRQIIKWLLRAWRGNYLQATLNGLIGASEVAVSLAQVWAMKHAIDIASHHTEGSLYWAVAIMAILTIATFALGIAATWIQNILGIDAQNRMQQQTLDRILRSEWQNKSRMHSGDMINRLELDVASVINFLTITIPSLISTFLLFAGAFIYLYMMDSRLATIIIIAIPFFLLLGHVYIRRMRQLNRSVRETDSQVQSILQESVQNRMLIKTLEGDNDIVERLEHTHNELKQRVEKRTAFNISSRLIVNSGFAFTYLLAFLWAAIRLSADTLSYGGMTAFLQLVYKIQTPARQLTSLIPQAVSVLTAVERLMELEEDPLEEQGTPIWLGNSKCGIRLENLTYQYPGANNLTLHDLSFDFLPGKCTGVVGSTGSGKTTLVRILLALFHPQEGRAIVYNEDGLEHDISPLTRCNFVYVPQGNTLMSGTIRDNLLLAKPDATDEEMREVLQQSCSEHIFDLPLGIDTPCTEKGGGLSEGQSQRIAIARALLRDRPIMIFDEATSALDIDTERQLLSNILAKSNKTVIFITHRKAVLKYCDNVLHIHSLD